MMRYEFPEISHINDVLPAIADAPEFIHVVKDGYQVINYVVMSADTFPTVHVAGGSAKMRDERSLHNRLRRECRGLVFDNLGKLINRRYHKFFNVNERDETSVEKIDWSQSHSILEKLDGSMVSPCMVHGNVRWMTKMGITDTSMEAEVFVAQHPDYVKYAQQCFDVGITPIFEWCSNKNRIVLDYPEDRLVLTALRFNLTGGYLPHDRMLFSVQGFDIPVVKAWETKSLDIHAVMDLVRNHEGEEGVVIRFDDGHMVKIKSDWYVRIHKVKALLGSEKDVTSLILNNEVDDILPVLPQEDANKVVAFRDALTKQIESVSAELYRHIVFCKDKYKARKEFAIAGAAQYHPVWRSMIFKFFDSEVSERDVYNNVFDAVKQHCTSNAQYAKIKDAFLQDVSYNESVLEE